MFYVLCGSQEDQPMCMWALYKTKQNTITLKAHLTQLKEEIVCTAKENRERPCFLKVCFFPTVREGSSWPLCSAAGGERQTGGEEGDRQEERTDRQGASPPQTETEQCGVSIFSYHTNFCSSTCSRCVYCPRIQSFPHSFQRSSGLQLAESSHILLQRCCCSSSELLQVPRLNSSLSVGPSSNWPRKKTCLLPFARTALQERKFANDEKWQSCVCEKAPHLQELAVDCTMACVQLMVNVTAQHLVCKFHH